jgi:adenylyl cyclase-associated protein
VTSGGEAPAVKAYDMYVRNAVIPFCSACDDLGGGLQDMGKLLQEAWAGVGDIIVLASRAKAPDTTGTSLAELLAPYLTKTQTAVTKIREIKLNRKLDLDRHQKAAVELLACLSWILFKPPNQPLPATCVKEALSSAEFWSNRIRKDFKGKDNLQIAFCDTLKKCLTELVAYIEEYHKAGLAWNAKGVSLAEAAIRLTDEAERSASGEGNVFSGIGAPPLDGSSGGGGIGKSPIPKSRHPTLKGAVVGGGNVGGLMSELANRKNADGSSAATGLRKASVHTGCIM